MIWMLFATAALKKSLSKVIKKWFGVSTSLQTGVESIPLLDMNLPNYMKKLYGKKKTVIKDLIKSDSGEVGDHLIR